MATRSLINGPGALRNPPSGALREEDYRTFCAALESTQRGRDFLAEYARRNRNADTEMLLDTLDRIETMMKADGAARDRLRDELRVLLIAIRLARPDINSATALTKAARLVDLLDMMERRIDAMVENKELLPIEEEPLPPAPAALSVVPRPDEPELPIPSFASTQPPPMALVQEVTIQELPKQELPKLELPVQEFLKQELPAPEPLKQEAPQPQLATPQPAALETVKPEPAIQETAIQALARQEALMKARRKLPADPYPLFAEEDAAPTKASEEKWLPDFGADETQIIHTKPVRSMAFMPEVAFISAPATVAATPAVAKAVVAPPAPAIAEAAPAVAETAPAVITPAPAPTIVETMVVVETTVVTETEIVAPIAIAPAPQAEPTPAAVRQQLRDHPLAAIMSLSEEERIALFT